MPASHNNRGWRPSPLTADWWGPLADVVWQPAFRKHGPTVRRKYTHRHRAKPETKQSCPCVSFRLSDLRWRSLTPAQWKTWDDAVKKWAMSGYELWMKESMTLLNRGENYPLCPSVSGGFACHELVPGPDAPEETIGKAPPAPTKYKCSGPPDYICSLHVLGTYDTLEECQAACHGEPVPWPPGAACEFCTGDTPSKLTGILTGLTPPADVWNDTYIMPYAMDCGWQDDNPVFMARVSRPPPPWNVFQLTIKATGHVLTCRNPARLASCYTAQDVPWLNGSGIFSGQTAATAQVSGFEP